MGERESSCEGEGGHGEGVRGRGSARGEERVSCERDRERSARFDQWKKTSVRAAKGRALSSLVRCTTSQV